MGVSIIDIKVCIDIWDFSLFGVRGIRSLALGSDALILPLSSESVYSLAFWIGMLLWFEAMMIALSFDALIGFLGFMVILGLWAYLLFLPRFYPLRLSGIFLRY